MLTRALAAALLLAAIIPWHAPTALAQEDMVPRSMPGMQVYRPVLVEELEGYCRTLGFDEGQAEAASALLEGYHDAIRAARREARSAREQARLESEGNGTVALAEGSQRASRAYSARLQELEQLLFSDLKLLLTPEQEAQWEVVVRARRRALQMDRGPVSTANVDLIKLVESVSHPWAQAEQAGAIMEGYELQLDTLLAERARAGAVRDQGPSLANMLGRADPELDEAIENQREVSLRIRQLNDATVTELLANIEEEAQRAELEDAYRNAKFSRMHQSVYRYSRTERMLAAAESFDDLSEAQREVVQSLRAAYEARLASLNSRWERELAEAEKGGEREAEAALASASGARRGADRDAEARLREVLDDAQLDRLSEWERQPKAREQTGAAEDTDGST